MRNILYTFFIAGIFLSCSKDNELKQIHYPKTSSYGNNILFSDTVVSSTGLSMAAELPAGNTLKVRIYGEKHFDPESQSYKGGIWYMAGNPGQIKNWTFGEYNKDPLYEEYHASTTQQLCDLSIRFAEGNYLIEIYENGDSKPTRTKDFKVYPYSW